MSFLQSLLEDTFEEGIKLLSSPQEIKILCGCDNCGKRLVHDSRVLEGVRIAYKGGDFDLDGLLGTPFCQGCWGERVVDYNTD